MRICAISPLESATKSEILSLISTLDHDLIVLPGWAKNHPDPMSLAKELNRNSYAFVETKGKKRVGVPSLVTNETYLSMPPQVFIDSPSAKDLDSLQSIWTSRTHKICNANISFAICGEIDAFQKDGKAKMGRNFPFEILINPTHTTRGRWNHLGEKLNNLSRNTVVVHVANNDYGHHEITTHIRIYKNKKIMPVVNSGGISYSECKNKLPRE